MNEYRTTFTLISVLFLTGSCYLGKVNTNSTQNVDKNNWMICNYYTIFGKDTVFANRDDSYFEINFDNTDYLFKLDLIGENYYDLKILTKRKDVGRIHIDAFSDQDLSSECVHFYAWFNKRFPIPELRDTTIQFSRLQ